MSKLDPTQGAQNWANAVRTSSTKYKNGIQSVKDNPAAKAIAQKDVWLANTSQSQQKYVDSLSNVSLQYWQSQAGGIGATKYSQGADKGQPKQQRFAAQFYPFLQQLKDSLPPRGTAAQNEARLLAMVRGAKAFKYNRSSI